MISKGYHDTVQGSQKTKTKQQKYNCIYKYNVYTCNSNDKAITVGGEFGLCPPPMVSWRASQMVYLERMAILLSSFLSDLGGLVLMEENISAILLLVSGVTKPREQISMQVRLQLYPFWEMSKTRRHIYEFYVREP